MEGPFRLQVLAKPDFETSRLERWGGYYLSSGRWVPGARPSGPRGTEL